MLQVFAQIWEGMILVWRMSRISASYNNFLVLFEFFENSNNCVKTCNSYGEINQNIAET
jgi:hypothetical protein